jgi:hypothetical protein
MSGLKIGIKRMIKNEKYNTSINNNQYYDNTCIIFFLE